MSPVSPPLFSEEAEQALLGACLIDPAGTAHLRVQIPEAQFYFTRHQRIWRAMRTCDQRYQALDLRLLVDELARADDLELVGGVAYLAQLLTVTATAMHAAEYAAIVRQYTAQRAGVQLAGEIARLCYAAESAEALTAQISAQVASYTSTFAGGRGPHPIAAVAEAVYDDLVRLQQTQPGVRTGLVDLDRLTGGLFPSDLTLLAARPGVGKTALLLTLARNVARQQRRVLVFSLEMAERQQVLRLLAGEARVDGASLRTGAIAAEEWEPLQNGLARLADLPLWFDDTPAATLAHLRATAMSLALRPGLDLVLVDYLQLITTGRPHPNRNEEVGYISGQLKALARELDVPVLAAAQLNRALEARADKRPTLADLRDSGRLEQDADLVLFLHRPGLYDPAEPDTLTELIVAKHRHGPTGTLNLIFQPRWQMFAGAALPTPTAEVADA